MTDAKIAEGFLILASAVQTMLQKSGTRITRAELAERWGIHRNTLATRLAADKSLPRPGRDGKWLLSEIVEWELHRRQ
ncbi:MAG: hypothetical protein GAK30_01542 [Paracidovorax wautersii]|uniref:Uncharacterized protein n=1 Tax=Paracidovorax wautersii TaxID=1177982 RepID=A0A7V8FPN5_9BURK|nr:MAG: hypothetical protein GAK30_01542 [Paracidovorax wautersii]